MAENRHIRKVTRSRAVVEGAGVHLRRAIGFGDSQLYDPFLLLDRVVELVPGEYAVAEKDIVHTMDVFRGHFPGHPVFPGVLQLEALAQTGAVAVLSQPEAEGKIILFGGVDKVRFRRQVVPGDTLRLEMRMIKSRGPVGKAEGKAYVDGRLVCSGMITFAVADAS